MVKLRCLTSAYNAESSVAEQQRSASLLVPLRELGKRDELSGVEVLLALKNRASWFIISKGCVEIALYLIYFCETVNE